MVVVLQGEERSAHRLGKQNKRPLRAVPHLVYIQLVVQKVMCSLQVEALFYLGVGTGNKVDGGYSDQQPQKQQ